MKFDKDVTPTIELILPNVFVFSQVNQKQNKISNIF